MKSLITDGRDHHSARVPVYTWADDLEVNTIQQALNCASLEPVHGVALMPDAHFGYGIPVGGVVALKNAISPYGVGNDIGCGMCIVPTTIHQDDLRDWRDSVFGWLQTKIPAGSEANGTPHKIPEVDDALMHAWAAMEAASEITGQRISSGQSHDPEKGRELTWERFQGGGRAQAGTLGSGNHFIEFLVDDDDLVWVMLHSGSRGTGSYICHHFHRAALMYCEQEGIELPDPGLAYLPLSSRAPGNWTNVGQLYVGALQFGLDYARLNRERMISIVVDELEHRFPGSIQLDRLVNIHHNDATLETHSGEWVWVHRKGAVKAALDVSTITPGSMGTSTVLGRGLGNPESYQSCSHGAGRVLGRGEARRQLDLQEQLAIVEAAGGRVYTRDKSSVLDEMPGAYKDLDMVMANQADLVEVVRTFTPIGTYKGSDDFGGRRKQKNRDLAKPDEVEQ